MKAGEILFLYNDNNENFHLVGTSYTKYFISIMSFISYKSTTNSILLSHLIEEKI